MTNLPPIRQLLDCPQLLAAAEQYASFDQPAVVAQLRKLADAPLVHAAIDLITARRKAAGKLTGADQLMLDIPGVEQASSSAVASLKAQRFAAAGLTGVIDLCCGIGGDAMELARRMNVVLIDRDPRKVWMARHNVQVATGSGGGGGGRCSAACADVTQLDLRDHVIHLDPARRSASPGHVRRNHDYHDYQPGPAFIADLLTRRPTAAVKLGPGVDTELIPPGEVQFISERGSLVQAVLWTGQLAHPRHARSATTLSSSNESATLTGTGHETVPYSAIRHYLLAVDPAVERASLIGQLCAQLNAAAIHPKLGLLTADTPITSPFTTCFEHLVTLPVRKVAAWLKQNDGGIIEVKTRGKAADPNQLQTQWRGKGNTTYTLFVLRHDQLIQAHITRRM